MPSSPVRAASWLSVASMSLVGVVGILVTVPLGPPLAMLVAMYGGNTLPDTPERAYPWLGVALGLGLVAAGGALHRKGQATAGIVVAHLGSVALVLLPLVHLWRLVALTGRPE